MCLYNSVSKVRKFLKSKKKYIKGYKIYEVDYKKHLYPFYYQENKVTVNKNRYIQSNTRREKPSLRHEPINKGLHMYTVRPLRLVTFRSLAHIVVIKVIGYRKDLLGIGCNEDGEAVFTKVRVSKRELIRLQTLGIKI